jgi:hypothetical protein
MDGGDNSETYSGIYRKGNVVARFSSFIAPVLVSSMMKALVSDFNDDIRKAEEIRN